jgi:hypothetical protein
MKNLKQLLGICEHKWIERELSQLESDRFYYFIVILKCEKCGKIKSKKV